jgi:hypothetical protein
MTGGGITSSAGGFQATFQVSDRKVVQERAEQHYEDQKLHVGAPLIKEKV